MKPGPKFFIIILLGLLVLWFPTIPLLALDAPAWVNDGTGSASTDDIDEQSDLTGYSAHWDAVPWSAADADPVSGDTLRYDIRLYNVTDGGAELVDAGSGSVESVYDGSESSYPDTSFSTDLDLQNNNDYEVRVRGYIERDTGGAGAPDEASDYTASDGFLAYNSPPTAQIDSLNEVQPELDFSVSWSGSDPDGIDSYRVEYRVGEQQWTVWFQETSSTSAVFSGENGTSYSFRVRATDDAGITGSYSSTVTTTVTLPTATIDSLPQIQTATQFLVRWSGSDTSEISAYDVQYSTDGDTWTDWQQQTTQTQAYFQGQNGQEYFFRARAYNLADTASAYSSAESTILNLTGTNADLALDPTSLQFEEGENEKPVELEIGIIGSGSITITEIEVEKSFPSYGTSSGPTENVNIAVSGGITRTVQRTVQLSAIDRAKALAGGQSGSATFTYIISGSDTYGNPVEASAELDLTVSAALPSALQIDSIEVELPPSPYYAGDQVENARVVVQATGNGIITGEILIDEESDWTEENSFSVNIDGNTNFDIEGDIPTDDPGEHTVTVNINDPVELSAEATYNISDQTPPFPPDTLTLVDGVAELSDFDGQAIATSNQSAGYEEFSFTGTAKMKLLSLDNTELSDVTVTELKVRYENDDPTNPKIKDGTVEKEAEGEETFVTTADGYLKVKKVFFDGEDDSRIFVDAKLTLPKLDNKEVMMIEGLIVKEDGIEGKSFSYPESDPKSFNAFGMEFRIHDVKGTNNALVVGEDEANDRYYFGLSGSITMESKKGTEKKKETLTSFQDLTIFSDGEIDGVISFTKSFDVIPDKLEFNKIELKNSGSTWKLKLAGKLKKLPEPLDSLNNTEFEISFDKDGNASGELVPIKELKKDFKGHKLGSDDDSEWELGIGTLDITFLAFVFEYEDGVFNKDFSEVRVGTDIYFDLQGEGGSEPEESGKRITFGELNANGDFEGGVRLNMEGEFDWHPPTNAQVLQNKQLALAGLNLSMDSIAIQTEPEFGIGITGSVVMGMSGVSGGVSFENLVLSLDGTISNLSDAITGGEFEVADSMKVAVSEIDWSTSPTSLSFSSNETTGEGTNQAPQKGEKQIQVESYVRLEGATVGVGDSENPTLSGGFEEFTFYDPVDGGRSFVLREASLETSGMEIRADVEYSAQLLRLAGSMKLPGDSIEADVVGKFGEQNDEFTMGVFVAVSGLNMMVSPGVFLDGIGGGFFVNPVEEDMELVRHIAGFNRPELSGEISEKRPGGEANPGSFALMLLGDFYISEKNFVHGRAMLTLTSNYFNLDAEASYAADTVEGTGYLAVGWDPAYAEGNLELELDYLSILKGEGNLSFYVYDKETWGVMGSYNLYLYNKSSGEISTGELFVGPPGLMVNVTVSQGVDWKIVSGSVTYEGMFWFWQQPASSKFGVYAAVKAKGEIMNLASGEAKLEGALIANPALNIYAAGSVRLKVRGYTLWKGSMWITAGMSGLDGGTGTNHAYDQMIEDARNMADEMESAKDELVGDMEDAQLELIQLSPEQMEAAGLTLVESGHDLYSIWEDAFQQMEVNNWPGGLPQQMVIIRSKLFGPEQQQMAQQRTQLEAQKETITTGLQNIESVQEEVVNNFSNYEDLLLEELPTVQELGTSGSPFEGYETETIDIHGESQTVTIGFDLDTSKAEQQVENLKAIRESFAEYQDAFIDQAGKLDAKLRQIDRILFEDEYNLSELSTEYTQQYRRIHEYMSAYIEQQVDQQEFAEAGLASINSTTSRQEIQGLNEQAAQQAGPNLNQWNNQRQNLINALVSSGGETPPEEAAEDLSTEQVFIQRGTNIWWDIPTAGFSAMDAAAQERLNMLSQTFGTSLDAFRSTWSQASVLIEQLYERKAELYALLFEIYDQLYRYGGGEIAVLDTGNAAGFTGSSELGIGFRTEQSANIISSLAVPRPEYGFGDGSGGSNIMSPIQQPTRTENQSDSQTNFQFSNPSVGNIGFFGEPEGGQSNLGVQETQAPVVEQTAPTSSAEMLDWKWVAVEKYFELKSEEIIPYIENPIFQTFRGDITSSNQYSADLFAEFEASHPIGVVEYSWRIEAAAEQSSNQDQGQDQDQDQGQDQQNGGGTLPMPPQGGFIIQPGDVEDTSKQLDQIGEETEEESGGGLFGNLFGGGSPSQFISVQMFIPWFSIGNAEEFRDTLLAAEFGPGMYALTIRARGAGGTSILRQGRFNLEYFDPQSDTFPVSSSIDASDATPPSRPVVELEGEYSSRSTSLYAEWSASDSDSGILRYEYAVVPYTASGESQVPSEVMQGSNEGLEQVSLPGGTTPGQFAESATEIADGDWENAGSLTEMNIRGLQLQHGERYVVKVRATNGAGLKKIGTSGPVTIDTTAPEEAQINSFEQRVIDGHPNSFSFTFSSPSDPESGIAAYSFALGSAAGNDDLWEWTQVGPDGEQNTHTLSIARLPVQDGQNIYLTVRGANRANNASDSVASTTVSFTDSSPPESFEVVTQPRTYTIDPDAVEIGWSSSHDPESGIVSYEYGIGTTPDSPDAQWWRTVSLEEAPYLLGKGSNISTGTEQQEGSGTVFIPLGQSGRDYLGNKVMKEGGLEADYTLELSELGLEPGQTYYFIVRATNGADMSTVAASGPLTVDTSPPVNTNLSAVSVDAGGGVVSLEIGAEDPESGVKAYRYTGTVGGSLAMGPPQVVSGGNWKNISAQGSPASIQLRINTPIPGWSEDVGSYDSTGTVIPAGSGAGNLFGPLIRIEVMNGAGLTAPIGVWRAPAPSEREASEREGEVQKGESSNRRTREDGIR